MKALLDKLAKKDDDESSNEEHEFDEKKKAKLVRTMTRFSRRANKSNVEQTKLGIASISKMAVVAMRRSKTLTAKSSNMLLQEGGEENKLSFQEDSDGDNSQSSVDVSLAPTIQAQMSKSLQPTSIHRDDPSPKSADES